MKIPSQCEALSVLRPIQLVGGEQTLFAVTAEGKVYATGYGAGGYSGYDDSTPPRSDHLYPEAVENDRYIANGGLASCARPMG